MDQQRVLKVFEYALNQEKTGMLFFTSSLEKMGIGAAKTAFEKLIAEEQRHIDFISGIIRGLREQGEISSDVLAVDATPETDFFDARARSEFLEECINGSMVPDVTVFNTAWLIERDLSEFYATQAAQCDGKAKEAFSMLSDWEKGHEKFFREFRDKLSEIYANMPWGG